MKPQLLAMGLTAIIPSLWNVALCALRLAPITYLCPILGGVALPGTVRLGCVLSLALALSLSGAQSDVVLGSASVLAQAAVRELLAGVAIGWISSLPFEGARMGGKLADLFRGTSAEAALPGAGSSDSASAEGFYRLAVALAASGLAFPQIVAVLWRSYRWIPIGGFEAGSSATLNLPELATAMVTTGLAVSAPVLAVTLGIEALIALVSRVAPGIPLIEASAPTRILGGGAVLWLGLGLIAQRTQQELLGGSQLVESFLQSVR